MTDEEPGFNLHFGLIVVLAIIAAIPPARSQTAVVPNVTVTTRPATAEFPDGKRLELPIGTTIILETWNYRVTPRHLNLIPRAPQAAPNAAICTPFIFRSSFE